MNGRITEFITTAVDDFRNRAIATSQDKILHREQLSGTGWDSLSIAHKISLMSPDFVSIEFVFQTYGAGAAHPNSATRTLNFILWPFKELQLRDLFKPSSGYVKTLSEYCVNELHRLQPQRWYSPGERAEELKAIKDEWICSGAAPVEKNFEQFVLVNGGIKIFFDPYKVGSYAEGRYEVFVPFEVLKLFHADEFAKARP